MGMIEKRKQWFNKTRDGAALPGAKAGNGKEIIFNVKGDFTAKFPKATLIAPWHKEGVAWAIGSDCRLAKLAQEKAEKERGELDSATPMAGVSLPTRRL